MMIARKSKIKKGMSTFIMGLLSCVGAAVGGADGVAGSGACGSTATEKEVPQ